MGLLTRNGRRDANRRWRWAALVLGAFVAGIGCNPMTAAFLLLPLGTKATPECPLAVPKKESKVVILVTGENIETRPELLTADRELSEALGQELKKRFGENKEKVKIVPYYQVRSYQNKNPGWRSERLHEIGKSFHADYVVQLEVAALSLYEKGSNELLYRGNADISISVTKMEQPSEEGPVWRKEYLCEYPKTRGPIPSDTHGVGFFRDAFMKRMARDMAKFFTSYEPQENYDCD